mmetsp:Transcript_88811/g.250588  ORF Transcript_88811/g.250588 Transcript_88811/m.250588 type:complete len:286 (-) Transcript_88811:618-1475(-)
MPRSPKPPGTKMPCAAWSRASAFCARCCDAASLPVSKSVASTQSIFNFRFMATAEWCSAATTDWYASAPPSLYLPTNAMTTSGAASAASTCMAKSFQSTSVRREVSGAMPVGVFERETSKRSSASTPLSKPMMCCSARTFGTWNKFLTSWALRIRAAGMLHWFEIFFFVLSWRGSALRQTIRSGCTPAASRALTECCVGFVFCPLMSGMYEQWHHANELSGRLNLNCLSASMKGMDSMSPTVPPSSIMQIWGRRVLPSTGTRAARSSHSMIAPVTCGMTCTVFPK